MSERMPERPLTDEEADRLTRTLQMIRQYHTFFPLEEPAEATPMSPDEVEQSRQAYLLFVEASKTYPASIGVQASYIAYKCQDAQWQPSQLFSALKKDRPKLQQILDTARKTHEHAKKQITIAESNVGGVLTGDFELAQEMMILGHQAIQDILENEYPFKVPSDEAEEHPDIVLEKKIREKIAEKKVELASPSPPDQPPLHS